MSLASLMYLAKQYADGARILAEWLGDGCVAVDRSVAQMRADICLSCPMNRPGLKVTESIASAIKEQAEFKLKMGMTVDGEHGLFSCHACGCHAPLKIWLPKQNLLKYATQSDLNKYDPRCWVTNTEIE